MGGRPHPTDRSDWDRLRAKVALDVMTGCWIWTASFYPDGYANFWFRGHGRRASRIAYELWKGSVPKDKEVLHNCDNPKCVNPSHLHIGTRAENQHEMVIRGRSNRGVDVNTNKLSEKEVLQIRKLSKCGESNGALAKKFSVTSTNIGFIVRGVTWKHLTEV